MSDYILKNGVLYHSNDYLMHYGKKGMKWKNHRYVENGNRPPDKKNAIIDKEIKKFSVDDPYLRGIYKYAHHKPKKIIDAYKFFLKNTNRVSVPPHRRKAYDKLVDKMVKDYDKIREEWLKPNSIFDRTS